MRPMMTVMGSLILAGNLLLAVPVRQSTVVLRSAEQSEQEVRRDIAQALVDKGIEATSASMMVAEHFGDFEQNLAVAFSHLQILFPELERKAILSDMAERVLRKSPVPVLVAKRLFTNGPKTIVVPTDFSPNAKQAAEEGLALTRAFGGRIVFLHVMERRTLFPPAYGLTPVLSPISPEMIEADWEKFLHDLPLGGGLTWEKQTREGDAARTITDIAKETGAELVVMGTHGRTGLKHMLLGSVTEKVVRLSECSILTVRPEAHRFELP